MNNYPNENIIQEEYNKLRKFRKANKKSIVDGIMSVVYTNPFFAKRIIDYFTPQFKPGDTFLDPCAGRDAFYMNLPEPKDWCEIQRGKDFITYNKKADWIFANYPWRGKIYTALQNHGLELADNVVSLIKFSVAVGTTKRFKDATTKNMFMKEVIFVPWNLAGFTYHDGSPKGAEGFILAIIHWQKNWTGGTTWNEWK